MTPRPTPAPSVPPKRSGFTLIEILLVVVIMAILLTLAGLGTTQSLESMKLTNNGSTVVQTLAAAHQQTMTSSRRHQVRFYRFQSDRDSGSNTMVRALQIIRHHDEPVQGPNGTLIEWEPVGSPVILDESIVISLDKDLSSIFETGFAPSPFQSQPVDEPFFRPTDPSVEYMAIDFLPNGQTNLAQRGPPSRSWHLSVVRERDELEVASGRPPNFVAIQIDPFSSKTFVFRP